MRMLRNSTLLMASMGATFLLVPAVTFGTPPWVWMVVKMPASIASHLSSLMQGLGIG